MKFSALCVLLLASSAQAAPTPTCESQKPCVSFSTKVVESSSCGFDASACVVEVCMTLNPAAEGCKKGEGATFSHACDQADANGCLYGGQIFDAGGEGQCPAVTGHGAGSDGKCGTVGLTTFCEQGTPGSSVAFIVKDGNDTKEDKISSGTGDKCDPLIECQGNLGACGDNDTQRPKERTWTFHIPANECTKSEASCGADGGPPPPPPATPTPPPASPPPPPATPPGTRGDPHFLSWQGEHFEYHGQCDMVLTEDSNFANGLGLDVHIRTKLVRYWSYIKNAAIRIGNDILEIEGSVDGENRYWMNYEYQGQLDSIGGFPVTMVARTSNHKIFEIDLNKVYADQKIVISTFKEFVRIDFKNKSEEAYGNTRGLLGDFKTGKTLARDGSTVIDVFSEFGAEWQVLPAEPRLFYSVEEPQFPVKCLEPEDPRGDRRRRLGESDVTEDQADAACGHLQDEFERKDCVYDILATQDLEMAGAY